MPYVPPDDQAALGGLADRSLEALEGVTGEPRLAQPHEGLLLLSHSQPTDHVPQMYEPSVCLVLRGAKETSTTDRTYPIAAGEFLIVSHDMPVVARITVASFDAPYVAMIVPLRRELLADLQHIARTIPAAQDDRFAVRLGTADEQLIDAFDRYLRALGDPNDAEALAPLALREIHYRLPKAIELLRHDLAARLSVSKVASHVGLSTSALHHHFKAVTGTSPVQYQKQLRLLEARRLIQSSTQSVTDTARHEAPHLIDGRRRTLVPAIDITSRQHHRGHIVLAHHRCRRDRGQGDVGGLLASPRQEHCARDGGSERRRTGHQRRGRLQHRHKVGHGRRATVLRPEEVACIGIVRPCALDESFGWRLAAIFEICAAIRANTHPPRHLRLPSDGPDCQTRPLRVDRRCHQRSQRLAKDVQAMTVPNLDRVEITSASMLWDWLGEHHTQQQSVLLVTWKAVDRSRYVSRDDVLDALIAYGWVDGRRYTLDDKRTMQLIAPRQNQTWARSYKERASRLEVTERIQPPGRAAIARSKELGAWDALDDVDNLEDPDDLITALDTHGASDWWSGAAPSYRRNILRWIATAKKPDTRHKRITIAAEHAARGEKVPNY